MSIDMLTSQLCDQIKNLSLQDTTAISKGTHKATQQALTAFSRKYLSEFDALVGDAACQVRAVMVASYAQNASIQEQCKKDLAQVSACYKVLQKNTKSHTCTCTISKESLELVKMYILKTTKTVHPVQQVCSHCNIKAPTFKEKTDPGKLSGICKANFDSLKTLVNSCSQSLSHEGLTFLREHVLGVSSESTKRMISEENVLIINDRKEIPCFYSIQAVMDIAIKEQIPLLIKVKKSEHTMDYDDTFGTAIVQKNGKEVVDSNDPLIVIEAMRMSSDTPEEYKTKLLSQNIVHLMQCNAAQHSQYTGKRGVESVPLLRKEEFNKEKMEIEALSEEAKKIGCHDQNRDLFCITHIFCDTMARQQKSGVTV